MTNVEASSDYEVDDTDDALRPIFFKMRKRLWKISREILAV